MGPDARIATAIRERRQHLGLRSEDVAARSGLSMSTIARIERGADTTLGSLQAIAKALETTVAKLLDGEAA